MVFGRIHCIARGLECPFYFGKKDKQKTGIGCSPIPVSIDPLSVIQNNSINKNRPTFRETVLLWEGIILSTLR